MSNFDEDFFEEIEFNDDSSLEKFSLKSRLLTSHIILKANEASKIINKKSQQDVNSKNNNKKGNENV